MKTIRCVTGIVLWGLFWGCEATRGVTVSPVDHKTAKRMVAGNSWRKGCPVSLRELRYLLIPYRDFNATVKIGEMVVHQSVAKEVGMIFETLYRIGYPVRSIRLVSDFGGSDFQSIEAGNTSAFNCRKASTGTQKWSAHAYGLAIDLNPIENPFVDAQGDVKHRASRRFIKRKRIGKSPADRAMLLARDKAVAAFKAMGWRWGGDYAPYKDYQHFEKTAQ